MNMSSNVGRFFSGGWQTDTQSVMLSKEWIMKCQI